MKINTKKIIDKNFRLILYGYTGRGTVLCLAEYRRQNNTIFVFPANGDMYNYIDIYDLCGRSISDDYEKASEPTA